MGAQRAALLTGLACTMPVVVWAAGVMAVAGGEAPPRLEQAAPGLWLSQALCLTVLMPGCATLWSLREAAAGVVSFVLFPLPVLVLGWLMGVLPAHALAGGPLVLAAGAALALAAATAMRALPGAGAAAGLLSLQAGLGTATVIFRGSWLAWTGL